MERSPFPFGLTYPTAADDVPLPDLTATMLAALAREVAIDINDLETILTHYKITSEQYERIKRIPAFAKLLESETASWNAANNAPDRIRVQAAAAFEDLLPKLQARLVTNTENLNHVVAGAQLIADVAGIGKNAADKTISTDRWAITINLGADQTLRFEKNAAPAIEPPKPDTVELLKALPVISAPSAA